MTVIVLVVLATLAGIYVAMRGNSNAVKIGAVFPLTGDTASYGHAAQRGIDLGVSEINDDGGIDGRPIQIIYEDDQGQPTTAVNAMRKLISVDAVEVILGSAGSSVTLAMCPLAEESDVVLITPISSSPQLATECGDHFFRVCPSDVMQARLMANWIREENIDRVALLYVNNSWGQGLREEFHSAFTAQGGTIVAQEACNEGERELRSQIARIKETNPDAVYAVTYSREGGAFLRQARELDLSAIIFGADVWGSPELVETAGDAARGVHIITPATFGGERYNEFVRRFREQYQEDPDVYASYAYDMIYIVAGAVEQAKTYGGSIRDVLARTEYEGITGTNRFDEHGDVVGKGFEQRTLE
jgi:ABC-type branched-subunit amino acid transport system substrate-binding protein